MCSAHLLGSSRGGVNAAAAGAPEQEQAAEEGSRPRGLGLRSWSRHVLNDVSVRCVSVWLGGWGISVGACILARSLGFCCLRGVMPLQSKSLVA